MGQIGSSRVVRTLCSTTLTAAAALVLAACGSLPPTPVGTPTPPRSSEHLSVTDFPVVVLAATEHAGSVHAERVESTHGRRTRTSGDTAFGGGSYRGRFTVAPVPDGATRSHATEKGELRLTGAHAFVHVPGLTPTGKFLSLDLTQEAPAVGGLCACLFTHLEPTATLHNMLRSLREVDYLGRDRKAGPSLEHYRLAADTADIPGAVDADHPRTTRVYQVWLDSRHRMRRMTYRTTDKTVDVTYSHWGERVRVRRPTPGRILALPGPHATEV